VSIGGTWATMALTDMNACSGIALCTLGNYVVQLIIYFAIMAKERIWTKMCPAVSRTVFVGWVEWMRLGLPAMGMMLSEWWAYELTTVFAVKLGPTSATVNGMVFTILVPLYMPALGVSSALSVRVGNHLGANNPNGAKQAIRVGLAFMPILQAIHLTFLIGLRHQIPRWIAPDETDGVLWDLATKAILATAALCFCDVAQCLFSGMIRGAGLQRWAFFAAIVGYWIVALPVEYAFAFPLHWGVPGMWVAMTIGAIIISIGEGIIVFTMNFERQIRAAKIRLLRAESSMSMVTSSKDPEGGNRKLIDSRQQPVTDIDLEMVENRNGHN